MVPIPSMSNFEFVFQSCNEHRLKIVKFCSDDKIRYFDAKMAKAAARHRSFMFGIPIVSAGQ